MRAWLTAYTGDQVPGQSPDATDIGIDVHRRQIGDRMASDFYVTFGDNLFTIPFRQLRHVVQGMIDRGEWD